jgi:hypothetical protein
VRARVCRYCGGRIAPGALTGARGHVHLKCAEGEGKAASEPPHSIEEFKDAERRGRGGSDGVPPSGLEIELEAQPFVHGGDGFTRSVFDSWAGIL